MTRGALSGFRRFVAPLIAAATLVLVAAPLGAATNLPPAPKRLPPRTNSTVLVRPGAGKTNAAAVTRPAGSKTNVVAITRPAGTNASSSLVETIRHLPSQRAFYPVVIGLVVCMAGILLFTLLKPKSPKSDAAASAELVPAIAARPIVKKTGRTGFQSCTVLQVTPNARKLWQFDSRFNLNRDQTSLPGDALPRSTVKDWRSLWQRKLNIAWLSPEHVFLRVAQFPLSDFAETVSMVELQLEKLSPMAVTQIVWSLQAFPHADGKMQTVVVMIVSRNVVEEFLGKLESQGYLADRLELPLLDQLHASKISENGAWIYPEPPGGRNAALVAWWYGGVLQNVNLITLPPEERAESLKEQLLQMAWAGEMEGWLTAPPRWHLVADPLAVAEWELPLREGLGQPLEIIAPVPLAGLAALTARRAAQADPAANLLPAEFATRYHQEFVDRLWMRGLGAVVALYLIGLLVYAVAVGFANYRTGAVEDQVARLGPTYTNVIALKAKYVVLKEREDLKFAGLDCWKAVAELMPDTVTLDGMNFTGGRRLTLNGTAPADNASKLNAFDAALRKKKAVNGDLLFGSSDGITWQTGGAGTVSWHVTLELKRGEEL
jgi:hypothetical protein